MTEASQRAKPVFKVVPYGHPEFFKLYGDAWGDKETLVSFYAPDGQYTDKASNVTCKGHEMIRRFMKVYLQFSPQCTVTFTNVLATGSGFAAEWIWEGSNDGPLRMHGHESPKSGSPWRIDGISIFAVSVSGKIQTHTDYWDSDALIRTWK